MGHATDGGAEFIDAEAEEEGDEDGVAGHFAADADPDIIALGGFDSHADESEYGGVGRFVEVGDLFVQAVDGEGVLDEVIGADTEEPGMFCEVIGDEDGGGDFDHGADFHGGIEGDVFGFEFGLVFVEEGIGLHEFVEAGDHGIHHFDVPGCAGAADGAQLAAEDFGFLEAIADGTPAEEGVHFLGDLEVGKEFVTAQVERSDDDLLGVGGFGDGAVDFVLFFLGGEGFAVEIEEFGAEEADAFGAAGADGVEVGGAFEVGGEGDVLAVEGDGGFVADGAEFLGEIDVALLELAVLEEGLVGGIEDEEAVESVQEDVLSGAELAAGVPEADDGGDLEGPGHDGGMGGSAADIGGEAEDHLPVEHGGGGGGEVVANDDAGFAEVGDVGLGGAAGEVGEDAVGDVAHIGDAFAEVFVFDTA
ncbi:MAG: hypothetical protein RI897_2595 [Verrucomicrobiota bacterium]